MVSKIITVTENITFTLIAFSTVTTALPWSSPGPLWEIIHQHIAQEFTRTRIYYKILSHHYH